VTDNNFARNYAQVSLSLSFFPSRPASRGKINPPVFHCEIIFVRRTSADSAIMEITRHANVRAPRSSGRNCFNGNANACTVGIM